MIDALVWLVTLIPLDVPLSPSPVPVRPPRSSGFAAGIVGGFFGLGLLVLCAFLLGLKPRRSPPPRPRL